MPFDPDEIARLSPSAREEVQDFYARKFLAEREAPHPDRRARKREVTMQAEEVPAHEAGQAPAPGVPAWPRVWFRNDSSRPTSFPHQWPAPFRARGFAPRSR
jgi:hypothetical protein